MGAAHEQAQLRQMRERGEVVMNLNDDDAEIIAAAREGFLEEAGDMLRQFETSLLALESGGQDREQLNAAFRAAHTIKGTAGLFGFHDVVSFTHGVESVMELLRSDKLALSAELTAVLLQCRDQMSNLLQEVLSGHKDAQTAQESARLTALLAAWNPASEASQPALAQSNAAAHARAGQTVWHICLRFGIDSLRNGLDPLAFLRYLDHMGEVLALQTWSSAVPPLAQLDAEACYLGFDLCFASAHSREEVAAVFEFAQDDCMISVLDAKAEEDAFEALLIQAQDDEGRRLQHHDWLSANGLLERASEAVVTADVAKHPVQTPASAGQATAHAVTAVDRRAESVDRRQVDGGRRGADAKFIRVRADKLDKLIDMIGELVIASSGAQMAAQQEGAARVVEATQRIHDLVQDARDGALGLRMVPIGETFSRFHRVVRDVSKSLGKEVDLHISGADTELDKTMVDTIADPLMHLVRNSLDHGIESLQERQEKGKPQRGQLALHAYHESGTIVIEVSDDGRGLDANRILRKAIERGLVSADQMLSDSDILALICHPGFSTAEQVTDISGRGVGMDVVKRNIEALRGQIMLASEPGKGTTTQIRLPLTLAIIDGFLCEVANVQYVVPLEMVVECIETPSEVRQCEDAGVAGYFDLRGETIPYLDLARYFGAQPQPGVRRSLLLVRAGGGSIGVVVDRLVGEHQTVIKPLGEMFHQLPGIAGSTILGSGDVALILDVPALVKQCIQQCHLARSRASGSSTRF